MGNNAQRATPGSVPGDTSSGESGAQSRVSGVGAAKVRTPPSGVRQAQPPPLPPMRTRLDSEEMTRVGEPNPMLLAIARGGPAKRPRHVTWFVLGTALGALTVWGFTSDVRADVYAARVWTANVLRSLRAPVTADEAPQAEAPPSESPPATEITEGTVAAPPAAPAAAPSAEIPTIDVSQLPRTPDTVATPPNGAAPSMVNAPGPR